MRKLFAAIVLAVAVVAAQAREKVTVWEQPATEFSTSYGDGFFYLALDVTRVELKADETVVHITARERSDDNDSWFQFAGDTYLKVGEERFTITSADGIELNKHTLTEKGGRRDMAFHFPPLPKGTRSFDFIEGDGKGAFQIKGIKPVEERWKQLFPSYWRDDRGDWKIAFFDDCAVYDCRFWAYKQRDVNPKTGEATLTMASGNDELKVTVGKDKKGQRTIQIGNEKAVYAMITSRFLPDYPAKDTRTDFVDTGYKTDTVTVVGWLKDMPEHFRQMKTFEFACQNLYTGEQESAYADLDSLGRFCVKIPVVNSTEFFCDWRRCFMRTMLEAGKTYFLLYDFREGRRLFMGDDARLQNELFKYPLDWQSISLYRGLNGADKATPEQFEQYVSSVDSLIKAQYASIDVLCQQHPTLSTRFNIYRKGNTLWQQARDFGQARFEAPNFQLPDHARRYAYDTFWTKMEKPYTLHRDFGGFLRDYLDDAERARGGVISFSLRDHYKDFASNDEELALLTRWKKWIDETTAEIEAEPTVEAKVSKSHELDSLNADLVKAVDKILQRPESAKIINGGMLISALNSHLVTLDSLGADPFIKNIRQAQQVLAHIEHERASLLPSVMDTVRTMISDPVCLAMIERQNDHYLAIENREFDRLVLKSSGDLANISEGEALLKKLVEPYKGKIVLLDIWGTWCGPCKEALSHSTEEYARLKDYDIQYLYLANNSPQQSWENVIKEYNVSGPNVAHYNLPEAQQSAIERYLNVHSWPTYKLFDREGRLLDLNVDPRQLDNLARLLENLP